jgi:hypothetical protein
MDASIIANIITDELHPQTFTFHPQWMKFIITIHVDEHG